ncbi:hypothetical protein STRIP9103_05103 [Streptomyces ipomoeae 91-03]|uniref:Uncharacterized protein n=1 Tax=Streptomyces ipomoeae 91-03 TaxID=698759 RepID=L1KS57_9ACTN|nr:hypothetical protein STRIP9103_05103 [Streptomyces ipomoeae 91-03]
MVPWCAQGTTLGTPHRTAFWEVLDGFPGLLSATHRPARMHASFRRDVYEGCSAGGISTARALRWPR